MVNSEIIQKKDHYRFLESLKNKKEGHWILKAENDIYGALNLTKYLEETDSFMGGNYSNPQLVGTGIGFVLNFALHQIAFEKVECTSMRAIIQKKNKNAIRLNKVFGGLEVNEFEISEQQYVEMYFKKENWDEIKQNSKKYLKYVF